MEYAKKIDSKVICDLVKDFMKDKDKQISIFITPEAATIEVTPYEKDEPRWIENGREYKYSRFRCSVCGAKQANPTPCCPICGERLKLPIEQVGI